MPAYQCRLLPRHKGPEKIAPERSQPLCCEVAIEYKETSMKLGQATRPVDRGLVASAPEQAAVAELMAPLESLVGRPPLYLPRAAGCFLLLGLLSPSEPADDEE